MALSVEEVERAIDRLPKGDRGRLYRRLEERIADSWGEQIEQDAAGGRLDLLLAQVDAGIDAARWRECP